jgi:hypothetical protein
VWGWISCCHCKQYSTKRRQQRRTIWSERWYQMCR